MGSTKIVYAKYKGESKRKQEINSICEVKIGKLDEKAIA